MHVQAGCAGAALLGQPTLPQNLPQADPVLAAPRKSPQHCARSRHWLPSQGPEPDGHHFKITAQEISVLSPKMFV